MNELSQLSAWSSYKLVISHESSMQRLGVTVKSKWSHPKTGPQLLHILWCLNKVTLPQINKNMNQRKHPCRLFSLSYTVCIWNICNQLVLGKQLLNVMFSGFNKTSNTLEILKMRSSTIYFIYSLLKNCLTMARELLTFPLESWQTWFWFEETLVSHESGLLKTPTITTIKCNNNAPWAGNECLREKGDKEKEKANQQRGEQQQQQQQSLLWFSASLLNQIQNDLSGISFLNYSLYNTTRLTIGNVAIHTQIQKN